MNVTLRLRGKLYSVLGLLLVALVAISFVGGRSIDRVSESAAGIYDQGLVPVRGILSIKAEIGEGRALLNAILGEPVETRQRELHRQIQVLNKQADEGNQRLQQNDNIDDEEKKLLASLKEGWTQYKQVLDQKVMTFVFDGDMDSAASTTRGVLRERHELISKQIMTLVTHFDANARAAMELADKTSSAAQLRLWAMSGAVLVACALAMILISRSITLPIKRVSEQLKRSSEETAASAVTFSSAS